MVKTIKRVKKHSSITKNKTKKTKHHSNKHSSSTARKFPWYAKEYNFNLARIHDIIDRRTSQLKIYSKPPKQDYPRYNKPFIPLSISKTRVYYVIRSPWDDNLELNSITDYFTEECRMTCQFGSSISPLDYWKTHWQEITNVLHKRGMPVNNYNVRELLYSRDARMFCNNFRVSVCLEVLDIFRPRKWLDISAGWGDRLVSALLSPWVEEYIGVDPNPCLQPGYKSIIQHLNQSPNMAKKHAQVIQDGFETATIPGGATYDIVLSSPPFFDLEIYSSAPADSLTRYNTVEKWFNGFLMPSITKAIQHLRKGGHLVLYMGEAHGTEKYISRMITATDKLARNIGRLYYTDGGGSGGSSGGKLREFYCWRK